MLEGHTRKRSVDAPPQTLIRLLRLLNIPLTIVFFKLGLIAQQIRFLTSPHPTLLRPPLHIDRRELPLWSLPRGRWFETTIPALTYVIMLAHARKVLRTLVVAHLVRCRGAGGGAAAVAAVLEVGW